MKAKARNYFEKDPFQPNNYSVFGKKTMDNVRNYRDIRLKELKEAIWCQNQTATRKFFSENLLATEIKKIWVKLDKPIYLDLSILEINKNVWVLVRLY